MSDSESSDQQRLPETFRLEMLRVEREKLQNDRERLLLERERAKWTNVSIVLGALAGLGTIGVGLRAQQEQARIQLETQQQQARSQFAIKAAEIVLHSESALGLKATAEVLGELFPTWLPENFAKKFDPNRFSSFGRDIIGAKVELLKMFSEKPTRRNAMIEDWKILFSEDCTFRECPRSSAAPK